jgi:hypothetical protein
MANENEAGKISKRKIPEFRVRKSQIRDMKASAKVLEMLSEKPEVIKKIVHEFSKIAAVPEEDAIAASYEAKQNILDILASNLKELPEEDIEKNISILWYHLPYIWYQIWYIPNLWVVWGPEIVFGQEGRNVGPAEDQIKRRYTW